MRIPSHLPEVTIGIGKVAGVTTPKGVLGRPYDFLRRYCLRKTRATSAFSETLRARLTPRKP